MDKHYKIRGMTCQSCERCIENALLKIDGIISAKANYKTGLVIIDIEQQVDEKSMAEIIGSEIEKLGYSFLQSEENPTVSKKQTAILLLAIIALAVGAMFLQRTFGIGLDSLQAGSALGLGILFLIGLINSLHCAAMCGGINLSLCASYGQNRYSGKNVSKLIPSFLYNMGRLFSYTIIGAVVGGLGAVINISPSTRGMGAILAGGFMLIMGLSMLDISFFRKIIPRMPKVFAGKLYAKLNKAAPFTVGLLNGLMPCGPLQSMQLFALGTGDALVGALSMFFFALGTVPLMFGLGALSSLLSHSFRGKMVKVGAVLVAVLGAFMLFMGISNAIR